MTQELNQATRADLEPVVGRCRFVGEKLWGACSVAHVASVLANPSAYPGYEVQYLYTHPAPSQPAQAGEVDERVAFEAWTKTQPHGKYPLRRDQEGQYLADVTEGAWDAYQAGRASLPTQPAAQATPEPDSWIADVLRDVAELPDRSSPDDQPDMMLVTAEELREILESRAPEQATPEPDTCRKRPRCGRADPCAWLEKQATQQAAGEPVHHRQAWAALTEACQRVATADGSSAADLTRAIDRFTDVLMGDTHPASAVPDVDALAQFIRQIDGGNSMGAGALAERISEWLVAQTKGS